MSIIRVENLKKSIKGKVILEDLSFAVERGDCLALIGPNGAGKTTLMNCLLGDRKVTSGIIEVEEKEPGHPRLKASVSYLPQENAIVQKLTVQELINFFRSIYPNPLTGEEIDDLLEEQEQIIQKNIIYQMNLLKRLRTNRKLISRSENLNFTLQKRPGIYRIDTQKCYTIEDRKSTRLNSSH